MRNFIVKEIDKGDYFTEDIQYGVYEWIEPGVHTKDNGLCNLIVLCHNKLNALKIREILELDDYIHEDENK